jgi:hypothetical protein
LDIRLQSSCTLKVVLDQCNDVIFRELLGDLFSKFDLISSDSASTMHIYEERKIARIFGQKNSMDAQVPMTLKGFFI